VPITRTIAVLLATTALAHAADDAVCRPYATAITNAMITWTWHRAFAHCSALDPSQMPSKQDGTPVPPTDWRIILDILDPDRMAPLPPDLSKIGVVPAAGPPGDAPAPTATPIAAGPAAICARSHMRLVWYGRSRWRCRK
jgi:hypothetical protein